jgi:hypothetical protein
MEIIFFICPPQPGIRANIYVYFAREYFALKINRFAVLFRELVLCLGSTSLAPYFFIVGWYGLRILLQDSKVDILPELVLSDR